MGCGTLCDVAERWDVVVVGAGPAGSTAALAALAAAPDARVLIVDRESFPRDKVCGDAAAAHVVRDLAALGVDHVTEGFDPVCQIEVRPAVGDVSRGPVPGGMHVIPRRVLDERLLAAAIDRGARFEQRRVRTCDSGPDGVVIDGSILAGAVVGADGAESVVRRQLSLPVNPGRHMAIAIRGYARTADVDAVVALRSRDWPAYAWSFPIGDGMANVGYGQLVRGSSITRAALLAGVDELLPGVSEGGSGWRAHRLPLSTHRPRQPDGRVLLAGDAASLVNPLSGEGIFYAVRSGALAGRAALLGSGAGAHYRAALRAELGRHLRHTSAAVRVSRSARLVKGGTRLMARSPRVFADVIDLGMGQGVIGPAGAAAAARALISR